MAKRGRDSITFRKVRNSDGSTTLHARFQVPQQQENGEIVWRRIERSTGTGDERKAEKTAERLKAEEVRKGYSEKSKGGIERTFAEAAASYMRGGGDGYHLGPILNKIGTLPLSAIVQEKVQELADELQPGCKASTINRNIYTPIIAVLRSAEGPSFRAPRIRRPKGSSEPKSNFQRPPKDWWARVLPHCTPHMAALILFLRLHGRRTTEAINIRPQDIDGETWRVNVSDTKQDQEISFQLAQPVIDALNKYPWRLNKRVFGYKNRSSVYGALRIACQAAGVPYHVPKDVGRHSFATHMLEQGFTLKEVQEAGRWANIKMPARVYGHLEQSHVDERVRKLGEQWIEEMGGRGEVISFKAKKA